MQRVSAACLARCALRARACRCARCASACSLCVSACSLCVGVLVACRRAPCASVYSSCVGVLVVRWRAPCASVYSLCVSACSLCVGVLIVSRCARCVSVCSVLDGSMAMAPSVAVRAPEARSSSILRSQLSTRSRTSLRAPSHGGEASADMGPEEGPPLAGQCGRVRG